MTEEINHSYDGGLYAELIRNRAFLDDATAPAYWSVVDASGADSSIALDSSNPCNQALTTSLRLTAAGHAAATRGCRQQWLLGHSGAAQYPLPRFTAG